MSQAPIRQAVEQSIALLGGRARRPSRRLYVKNDDGTFTPLEEKPTAVVTLRLAPALRAAAKEVARAEGISMNTLAVLALEYAIREIRATRAAHANGDVVEGVGG